jgi:hypothetical protein
VATATTPDPGPTGLRVPFLRLDQQAVQDRPPPRGARPPDRPGSLLESEA